MEHAAVARAIGPWLTAARAARAAQRATQQQQHQMQAAMVPFDEIHKSLQQLQADHQTAREESDLVNGAVLALEAQIQALSTQVEGKFQALAEQVDELGVTSQDDAQGKVDALRAELREDVGKVEEQLREEFVAVTVRCDKLSRDVARTLSRS